MTNYLRQKYQSVIDTIGEQKVNELYHLLGPEKISMATLQKIILRGKIASSLNGRKPVSRVASENGVSRMTIYRQLRGR